MFRFASKLEFGELTTTVAETAVRLSQRMIQDWMVVGRRPSGVCGACLILAARIHNFRRTVTEVVYIVKVTTATIQKRMEEFKLTASANLTVDEFLHTEFLESAHDPPSFYQKQEEYINNKKTRKRKRRGQLLEDDGEEDLEEDNGDPARSQKTADPNLGEALPAVETRFDADGFAIPAQPVPAQPVNVPQSQSEFEDLVDEMAENPTNESLAKLVEKFGDVDACEEGAEDNESGSPNRSIASTPKRGRPRNSKESEVRVPREWEEDEERIQNDILELISDPKNSEMVFDPNTKHHAALFSIAEKRSLKHIADFEKANPPKQISDSQTILEDEFANDPEVQNCLLCAEDIEKKEKVWVNENKTWLRKQQIKAYQKRMEANGPPKRTRNRKKAIRIGEYQTSPASSAGEAATNVMQKRALSKKINYANIESLFDDMNAPGGGALGSAATSRVTSRAGSSVPESPSATDERYSEMGDSVSQAESSNPKTPSNARASPRALLSSVPAVVDIVDVASDDDDYVRYSEQQAKRDAPEEPEKEDSWRLGNRTRHGINGSEDEGFPEDGIDDYGEDIGDGALEDLESNHSSDMDDVDF